MGLKDVKDEILEEAEEKAENIKEEGRQEKDEIIAAAEEKAEKIEEETEQEIENRKEAMEKKAISNANMTAKKKRLEAKEDAISKVFEEFHEGIENISDDEKEKFLQNAVDSADFEVGKVLGSSEFSSLTDKEFEEIEDEGVIVVSENGERRRNFTFSKILEDFREDYRKEVAERLFD